VIAWLFFYPLSRLTKRKEGRSMEHHNCDICKFLVQYSNGKRGLGREASMRCCRYPVAKIIEHPDNHKCGEHAVDYDELVNLHNQAKWKLERVIVDLNRDHKGQVERLRTKHRIFKNSIEIAKYRAGKKSTKKGKV
jgi:hypothetical protein